MSSRPDALDLRIDAMPDAQLLHHAARELLDPERQAAATRLAHLMFPGWFISIAASIVVLAYFWQSGLAARLRDQLSRRFYQIYVVRFLFGAALALVARLAALIPEFYIYRVQRSVGLSDQLLRAWGSSWLVNTALAMVSLGAAIAIVLWIVDRTHQWYLYLIGAFVLVSISLTTFGSYVVLPHFGYYGPLPANLAIVAADLETRSKQNVPIVEHVDERSRIGSVSENGLFLTERIIVGDSLVKGSTERELRYLIAKELGFVELGGPLRVALFNALFAVLGIALAVAVADRIGFRRDDDPLARLALLGALVGVVYLAIAPIDNGLLRAMSLESEKYAIALTGDRAAAVRSIVRTADQRLDPVCSKGLSAAFLGRIEDPDVAVELANNVRATCP
jgi:hypothetical protein